MLIYVYRVEKRLMILYYVHDPMCGWCWGFQTTWQKIQAALEDDIQIKYLLGGLAPDSDAPMPEAMKTQIEGYWKRIQQHIPATEFNYSFWKDCKPRRSTYPACRAVIAARKQKPEIEKPMITAIQKAYYLNAQNPSDDETLIAIAKSFSLNTDQFSLDLNAQKTQTQLEEEILFARQIGAQGFPSMIVENEGQYHYVPLDYNNPSAAVEFIREFKQ